MRIRLDVRAVATVLAALRYWQARSHAYDSAFNDIATDGGRFDPLDDEEIDTLCECLNFSSS